MGEPTSLVGGGVRDALLGRPSGKDVDLVVEGDASGLARRLGRALGVRVDEHAAFGTAELHLPDGTAVDLVRARRERYPQPGALPQVSPGTLEDDLRRRDFAVNAMAYRLSGPGAGALVDPAGGRADLDAGVLRILRAEAFREDPSRLVRAARYAARLGFRLDDATAEAARAAAPALDPRSARVADEFGRLAGEPDAARAAALLASWGVPWALPADPTAVAALDRAVEAAGAPPLETWALRLGLLVRREALPALAVPGWAVSLGMEVADGPALATRLGCLVKPSEVDRALASSRPGATVAAAALGARVVPRWWSDWRDLRLEVDGSDLVRAGIPPGPAIGRALAAVRAAVLDGEVTGREEQLALALEVAGG